MKKCLLWMLAAILLCGTTATLTSCNEETKILDLNGNSVEYGKKLSVSSSELLGWKVLLYFPSRRLRSIDFYRPAL